MTKTEQLQVLFEKWKKAQIEESEADWNITKPAGTQNIKKNFFCEDGIVDETVYNAEPIKVLFLTNEANIENYVDPNQDSIGSRVESFNYYHNSKNDNFGGKLIERTCSLFQVIINDYSKPPYEYAKRFAFMNLNKRGGDKEIKTGIHLDKYCELYSKFILEEISIINPDIIIWLGIKSFKMKFKEKYLNVQKKDGQYYINLNNKMIPLIGTWHTSYTRIRKSVEPMPQFKNNLIIARQATHLKELLDYYKLP